tara:strand:- start:62 stop:556 length:495 start_codon:yes stop_codon:yes gene_type:complete
MIHSKAKCMMETDRNHMRKSLALIAIIVGALAMSAACSPRSTNRGHIPPPSQLEKLKIGQHLKSYVRNILGAPSTVGTFDNEVWYYIGRRIEQWAFFRESIIEQKIVAIYFNDLGKIEYIQRYSKQDGREIEMVGRKTPTSGRELGVIEQIIGNLGRFNKQASQ